MAALSQKFPIKLGLDLQGGTETILRLDTSKLQEQDKDDALLSAQRVIENRVNSYGVSEAVVQTAKVGNDRRLIVDLPGVDASSAGSLIGRTAQLEFREQPATFSAEATKSGLPLAYFFTPTNLTGADLVKAQATYNSGSASNASPVVNIQFNSEGAKKFDEITKRNVGKPLAIFLDNNLVEAPVVQQEIVGGNAVINGGFTPESARQLVIELNAGALKAPIITLSQRTISASLGQESISKSLIAGLIGLVIVILYMAFYYGWLGIIADAALLIYTLLVLAIFKTGLFILIPPVTLSVAGIAGFILSVGMAVDANILIFERIKEERRWGKDKKLALELGFKRAFTSIRDSNISSLITAFILANLGTSIVKGFAITLGIGVLVSMFTAVFVTRTFLKVFYR